MFLHACAETESIVTVMLHIDTEQTTYILEYMIPARCTKRNVRDAL